MQWNVSKNFVGYSVWRQIRALEPGEPMHSGARECIGQFDTKEEAQKYADRKNLQE